MNTRARRALAVCALAMTSLYMPASQASLVIQGTRVIYPAAEQEVVVRMENKGERPTLVQTWLDSGDKTATPTTAHAPFTATPPVFRIDPGKQQALRLRYTGEPLPTDRESLYWLNVMEIQPKALDAGGRNLIELSFRSRMRVFFRPEKLPIERSEATSKLTWKLIAYQGGYALAVLNPTPYHISLASVELVGSKGERFPKAANKEANDSLLFPAGDVKRFLLPTLQSKPAGAADVEFTEVTDFGARVKHSVHLSPDSQ
ncbi:fimbria/pilus periplasmic chaperone [Pseudomonas sp. McL0111]|uniref:fimbria/pilus periplasmic chaperone n=1 Tax=Pseudomonas sp. McL0111 TaxID=3457357 RepID=UPI00403E6CDA